MSSARRRVRSTCHEWSRASTRQVPNSSESWNEAAAAALAIARAAASSRPGLDGEVDVDHLAADQGVPDGAPDHPAAVEHVERGGQAGRSPQRLPHPAHDAPTYSRSTRGKSPVVTS